MTMEPLLDAVNDTWVSSNVLNLLAHTGCFSPVCCIRFAVDVTEVQIFFLKVVR